MKLRTKTVILTTVIVITTGLLVAIFIRGIVISALRAEIEKKADSIAGSLSGRIANLILLGDYFQTVEALNEVLEREKDVEYIFVTDENGEVFAHTFSMGFPPDILSWNPLNNKEKSVQLLDTEKGHIRDVGIMVMGGTASELHLGIREESLKNTLSRLKYISFILISFAIFINIIAAIFLSRLITEPLRRFVGFTKTLGRGEYGELIEVKSKDEIGELAQSFNALSVRLKSTREKMEEAYTYTHMLQAEKLSSVGQISAGLAHELKNPVTTLKMLLQSFRVDPDMTKEDAEVIYNEVENIEGVLAKFLSFIEQKDFNITDVDLSSLIQRVLSFSTFDIRTHGITVLKNIPEKFPVIRGDRALLDQVFLNLILNAIQAMPNGGEIMLSGKINGNFVEINVADKGKGIPYNIKPKIFNPFFTTKKGGTGLGLSIAYNIVSAHGGKLSFESHEGVGTVFIVRLPIRV